MTTTKGIQSYVNYLLEDIKQAEGNVDELNFERKTEADIMEHIMEMERLVLEEPLNTIGEICGLTTEQFPPVEQLSKMQVKKIVKAFHQLIRTWNIDVVIPKKYPAEGRYKMMIPLLDRKTHILKNGITHIEFCEYEPEECPFGTYCDCKELFGDRIKPAVDKQSGKTKSSSQENQ